MRFAKTTGVDMQFAYTRLVTNDVRHLSAFYERLLGAPAKGTADYVELRPGGAILAIISRTGAQLTYGGEWPPGSPGRTILEFCVDDVDAEQQRIDGFVREWLQRPKDMPWGNRSMLFRDPDGNPINFFQPIERIS
jgi:predicted enzyme related to lactoylglutathione lyase